MADAPRTHTTESTSSTPAARRNLAVKAAVTQGLIGPDPGRDPDPSLVCLLDTAGIRASAAALTDAFAAAVAPGTPVLHAFAVKAAPLVPVLRLLDDAGIGCEVASAGELALARAAGVAPERTVLDSPAKTPAELREALSLGIAVNADNRQELHRLDALVAAAPTRSPSGSGSTRRPAPAPSTPSPPPPPPRSSASPCAIPAPAHGSYGPSRTGRGSPGCTSTRAPRAYP